MDPCLWSNISITNSLHIPTLRIPPKHTSPLVTHHVLTGLKKLLKKKEAQFLVQEYKKSPLLWQGRKFTLQTFALVTQTYPTVKAFMKEGVVFRALDLYGKDSRSANISTSDKFSRDSFGCMGDLDEYFSFGFQALMMPHLKRLMKQTIMALVKEKASRRGQPGIHTMQTLCFNFQVGQDYTVSLLDASFTCDLNPGGDAFSSECKTSLRRAFGQEAIKTSYTGKSTWFEPLMMDTSPLCSREKYDAFLEHKQKVQRAVYGLTPEDGAPRPVSVLKKRPWECSHCHFTNEFNQHHCDQCGSMKGGVVDSTPSKSTSESHSFNTPTKHAGYENTAYRQQLLALFEMYDGARVSRVDMLLERYRGHEEKLIERTRKQYEELAKLNI